MHPASVAHFPTLKEQQMFNELVIATAMVLLVVIDIFLMIPGGF